MVVMLKVQDICYLLTAIQNDERNIIGMEYSGRDENGRRVMGFTHYLGMATKVIIKPECMWYVPDHWSLEEAATVPVVYSTVKTLKNMTV